MSMHRYHYVSPGKHARGEAHHLARLTPANVLDMRVRGAAGESLKDISATYPQVSKTMVHHILNYRSWNHCATPDEVEPLAEIHRAELAARPSHGCVCPVGAEKTCAGPLCPRKPIGQAA